MGMSIDGLHAFNPNLYYVLLLAEHGEYVNSMRSVQVPKKWHIMRACFQHDIRSLADLDPSKASRSWKWIIFQDCWNSQFLFHS